jgi:16S rRNA (cytosine1402-N4)-methyltransferase
MEFKHTPVLLKEVIENLRPSKNENYFDGTVGGGGYACEILKHNGPNGKLVGVDVDAAAIAASNVRLENFKDRAIIENQSYADILKIAEAYQLQFDGAVLDLGVSSYQLDEDLRGFSFSKDAPLDMRMSGGAALSAFNVVNEYSEKRLVAIFEEYGEERFADRIAGSIIEKRRSIPIKTTLELEEICFRCYPRQLRKGRIHPATKIFQAIRIEVNGELENLKKFLSDVPRVLKHGGRIVIVSYHSLEDRIVKTEFRQMVSSGGFEFEVKKAIRPADSEILANPRSRSAKLRCVVKK